MVTRAAAITAGLIHSAPELPSEPRLAKARRRSRRGRACVIGPGGIGGVDAELASRFSSEAWRGGT